MTSLHLSTKIPWRRDRLPTPVFMRFPHGSDGKEPACNVGDLGSIPGLGRSPQGGHGNPLQHSCLENPRTEEPGRLLSIWSWRVGHIRVTKHCTESSPYHPLPIEWILSGGIAQASLPPSAVFKPDGLLSLSCSYILCCLFVGATFLFFNSGCPARLPTAARTALWQVKAAESQGWGVCHKTISGEEKNLLIKV